MPLHEHYEELCALATAGHLPEHEWTELSKHLQSCEHCRAISRDFEDICLIMAEAAETGSPFAMPEDLTEKFIARARAAGIPLDPKRSNGRQRRPLGWHFSIGPRHVAWAAVALIVLVATSFFIGMRSGTNRSLSLQRAVLRPQDQPPAAHGTGAGAGEAELLAKQLGDAEEQLRIASTQLKQQKATLESAKRQSASLSSEISELQASTSALRDNESRQTAEVAQLQAGLEKMRSKENDARTALLASENNVARLTDQLKGVQDLNAALQEAHELIVDRNVHVLNVFPEVDENGPSPQPRGRIFYAEGKKLVFYAYDLADTSKINAKASFYLWGEEPTVQHLVSLGKFQVDSEQQGRWVLRVTDPRLLAHISSVFVTLERNTKAVTKPSGKRMLSRLLQKTATHE